MIFNKNIVLAMIAFAPAANAANLRSLTECPTNPAIDMTCKLYKNQELIATLDPSTTAYELEEYDPESCYNIFCENNDPKSFVKFTGDMKNNQGEAKSYHDAWKTPFWLGGWEKGCMDLAPSCEELDLTIETWRNPSPAARKDPVALANHICAAKTITCKDPCKPKLCESKDDEYVMYRLKAKDNKCEEKCVKQKDFLKKESDGYSFCPCKSTDLPPQSCVLKRSSQLFKFEEWPERDDVYIQIKVEDTDRIYSFYRDTLDTSVPEFMIDDPVIFADLKNAQDASGISMRFVSKRGNGDWNSCKYSPIGLDLSGNKKVDLIKKTVFIDISGDGEIEELLEWFSPNDGILVNTKKIKKDGEVTGKHLMGDMNKAYTDGFDKLKGYDKDGNGIVEGKELNDFEIWVDEDSNAKLDDGELHSLEEYKIIGLRTTHHNMMSEALLEDGGVMVTEDLWFAAAR